MICCLQSGAVGRAGGPHRQLADRLAGDRGGGVRPALGPQVVQLGVGPAAEVPGGVAAHLQQVLDRVVVLAGRQHARVQHRRLRPPGPCRRTAGRRPRGASSDRPAWRRRRHCHGHRPDRPVRWRRHRQACPDRRGFPLRQWFRYKRWPESRSGRTAERSPSRSERVASETPSRGGGHGGHRLPTSKDDDALPGSPLPGSKCSPVWGDGRSDFSPGAGSAVFGAAAGIHLTHRPAARFCASCPRLLRTQNPRQVAHTDPRQQKSCPPVATSWRSTDPRPVTR